MSTPLDIQHAKHMHHSTLSTVVCLGVPYLCAVSHIWHNLWKMLLNTKFVFFFSLQLLPKTFLILRRIWQDAITVHRSSYKVPITLVRFYWNLNFLERVSKIPQVPYLKTISPLGAKLFRADGQRDRHAETYSHFLQFCKLNYKHLVVCYFFYNYTLLCSYNWGLSHLINKCVACQSFHIFLTCTRWWFTD